jgi:hypothetical protein
MRTFFLALALLAPTAAHAWDGDTLWGSPANGGNGAPGTMNALVPGGGGIYGTGGARDYNITCASCHVNDKQQQGKIDGKLTFNPPLGAGDSYRPGTQYTIGVALVGEHLGLSGCGPYVDGNINQFGASIEDAAGKSVGVLASDSGQSSASCPAAAPMTSSGTTLLYGDCHAIVSRGGKTMVNTTSWSFTWSAPAAGTGPVTISWGVVDGDCAMDSFGDDVKTGSTKLTEGTAAREAAPGPYGLAILILGPALAVVSRRRRRDKR